MEKKPQPSGGDQENRPSGTPGPATARDDLNAFAEFDPEAAEKIHRTVRKATTGVDLATLPPIMSDDEVEDAAATRRHDSHNPYVRKERPDPWPIIEHGFPRIAATIRQQWGKRALDDYFASLVVDDRGSRQGFPPEVLAAILEVARLHGNQYAFVNPVCPWEADVSQTKWWSRG